MGSKRLDCVLAIERTTMSVKIGIEPKSLPKPFGVWTPAIACEPGQMLFISGLTARAPDGSVVGEGDYRAQLGKSVRI